MYNFFYTLYLSLLTGSWQPNASNDLTNYINKVTTLVVNAFGGHFTTIQAYDLITGDLTAYGLIANVLAIVTMCGVCALVWKLTKGVFLVFFGGR